MRFHWILLSLGILLPNSFLAAQAPEADETSLAQATTMTEGKVDVRVELLNTLREDIEPNLPAQDAQRLKRNVSRMGSFRDSWVKEAQEFLIANAPLAELYLYDYARLKNERLTLQIIDTLLNFESYRYPQAVAAFADNLSTNQEGKRKVLELFRRVLQKSSQAPYREILSLVFGSWGQGLPPQERLSVALTACQSGFAFSLEDEGSFSSFSRNFPQFWAQVFWEELRRCFSQNRRM